MNGPVRKKDGGYEELRKAGKPTRSWTGKGNVKYSSQIPRKTVNLFIRPGFTACRIITLGRYRFAVSVAWLLYK